MDDSYSWAWISLIASVLILIQVRRDCRQLGEPWGQHILLVLFLWPIFCPLWLLVWPGSLRLWFQGKSLADTPQGWANRRLAANRPRHK